MRSASSVSRLGPHHPPVCSSEMMMHHLPQVHEVQDGCPSTCPFSPAPVTGGCFSYHMLPSCTAPFLEEPKVFMGVSQYALGAEEATREHRETGMYPEGMRRKKGCCICVSNSVASKVAVMVRRCEGPGCPITYMVELRCLCMRHTPPSNLVGSDMLIDERQLMEFCFLKGRSLAGKRRG